MARATDRTKQRRSIVFSRRLTIEMEFLLSAAATALECENRKSTFPKNALIRIALDESRARIQQSKVVCDGRIVRFTLVGLHEFRSRGDQIAPQHVRITLIVQNLRRLAGEPDRLTIGAVSQV